MKAWITYDYLQVKEVDGDGDEIDTCAFEHGMPVEVLAILPPSYVSYKGAWMQGMFVVRNSMNQEYLFNGSFITFINPNEKEIN